MLVHTIDIEFLELCCTAAQCEMSHDNESCINNKHKLIFCFLDVVTFGVGLNCCRF